MLHITQETFQAEVMESQLPVLVDFWAPWCGPCKALAPTLDKVAAEMEGKVKVAKVNVDDAPELASRYSIMSIPSLLLFVKGEVATQMVGLVSIDKIREKLSAYL